MGTRDPCTLTEPIKRASDELAKTGLELAIGVSTAFETTAGLPDAYRDACTAIESLGSTGGVMALADRAHSTI
jgi:hypothetical protein